METKNTHYTAKHKASLRSERICLGHEMAGVLLDKADEIVKRLHERGITDTGIASEQEYLVDDMSALREEAKQNQELNKYREVIARHFEFLVNTANGRLLSKEKITLPGEVKEIIGSFDRADMALYHLHYFSDAGQYLVPLFGRERGSSISWEDASNVLEIKTKPLSPREWVGGHEQVELGLYSIASRFGVDMRLSSRHMNVHEGDEKGRLNNPDHPDFNTLGARITATRLRALFDAEALVHDPDASDKFSEKYLDCGISRKCGLRTGLPGRQEIRRYSLPEMPVHPALDALMLYLAPLDFATDPANESYYQSDAVKKTSLINKLVIDSAGAEESKLTRHVLHAIVMDPNSSRIIQFPKHYIRGMPGPLVKELGLESSRFFRNVGADYTQLAENFFRAIDFKRKGDKVKIEWPDDKTIKGVRMEPDGSYKYGDFFGSSREFREKHLGEASLTLAHQTLGAYRNGEGITGNTQQERRGQYLARMKDSPIFQKVLGEHLLNEIVRASELQWERAR